MSDKMMSKWGAIIKEHYLESISLMPEHRVIGVFCQGSQNYGLEDEKSDMDTKCLYIPSFQDYAVGNEVGNGNYTHYRENKEHIVFIDIRSFVNKHLQLGSPNFVELLFAKVQYINPIYQEVWDELVAKREEIARYNPQMMIKSMLRMIQNKAGNLAAKKTYPTRMYMVEKLQYDPKELSHEIRMYYMLNSYIQGESYDYCLRESYGTNKDFIIQLKRGVDLTYEEALQIGNQYSADSQAVANSYLRLKPYWRRNEELHAYMKQVLLKIMKIGIKNEVSSWEE